jgi:serine/threonine protein kinase
VSTDTANSRRLIILVVRDEEVHTSLLGHFPDDRYELLFARGPAEAVVLCETRPPRLIVLPTDVGEDLIDALIELRNDDTSVIGIASTTEERDEREGQTERFDRVVLADKTNALYEVVRGLVKERRKFPRVNLEFPITLDGDSALVHTFSATSLQVETSAELQPGKAVKVEIGWGAEPHTFWAIVGKMQPTVFFGEFSLVLYVHPQEPEAKAFLARLAQRVIELKHIIAGVGQQDDGLMGSAAWRLNRRVEEVLLATQGLLVDESGKVTVGPDVTTSAAAHDVEGLEARYQITGTLGVWGVGEVYRARHRSLNRPVLLKRLRPDLRSDRFARQRMELEARNASAASGRYVVDVIDYDDDGADGLYYSMETLLGELLRDALKGGRRFQPLETAYLGVHLAEALTALHLRGMTHGDLCPENIFLHRPGGTTIRPMLINIAGRKISGPPLLTHAMGARYQPSQPSEDLAGRDVYALSRVLRELFETAQGSSSDRIPLYSKGEQRLDEVLTRVTSTSPSEGYPEAETLGNNLEEALELLENEEDTWGQARLIEPLPDRDRLSNRPTPVTNLSPPPSDRPTLVTDLSPPPSDRPTLVPDLSPPPGDRPPLIKEPDPRRASNSPEPSELEEIDEIEEIEEIGEQRIDPRRRSAKPPPPPARSTADSSRLPLPPPTPQLEPDRTVPPPPAEDLNRERDSQTSGGSGRARLAVIGAIVVVLICGAVFLIATDQSSETSRADNAQAQSLASEAPEKIDTATPAVDDVAPVHSESPAADGALPPDDVARVEPEDQRHLLLEGAERQITAGDLDEADRLIDSAILLEDGSDARYLRSVSLEQRRQYRAALNEITIALRIRPDNPNYHDQMGKIRIKLGQHEEGCRAFRQAIALYPPHRGANRHLERYCGASP